MRAWRTAKHGVSINKYATRSHALHSRASPLRSIADLLHGEVEANEDLSTQGWVRSVRKQKKIAFAAISDGSTTGVVQAVLKPEDGARLSTGAAVRLSGRWIQSAGKGQSHELQVSNLEVLGENDGEHSPLQPKFQTPEFLRTIPHLRVRVPSNALLLQLRSQLIAGLTRFFDERDFVQAHTPIITSSDCEGAGEVFTVSPNEAQPEHSEIESSKGEREYFFRSPKYLTVSGQLHLEALAQAVNNVWTLSPTFRAEKSDTPRHLSEFYMLEAEICFTQNLDDVMTLVEDMLRAMAENVSKRRTYQELLADQATSADAKILEQRWDGLLSTPWPRITYVQAIDVLEKAKTSGHQFESPPNFTDGLQAEHERYIATHIGKGKPVFVTHYPRAQKPFYMLPSPTSTDIPETPEDTVACFDLLVPELCELAGGSLREHRPQELLAAMRSKGVAGEILGWYHDLRRFGSVPHGGFGLGFDRLICYLSGRNSVRDVVAFPRWYGRCDG